MIGDEPRVLVLAGTLDPRGVRLAGVTAVTVERVADAVPRTHLASDLQLPAAVLFARFASGAAANRALTALRPTESGPLDAYLATERVIFERSGQAPGRRRLSLLRRRPEFDAAAFADYWHDLHAPLATVHQGVSRYAQYPVHSHRVLGGAGVPMDGIGEFVVVDAAAMERGYATPTGQRMAQDAQRFLAASTTFFLDPTTGQRSAA